MLIAIVVIAIAVILLIAGFGLTAKRRKEAQNGRRRLEASETRDLAKASQLEADRVAAGAEERAARAKRENVAAEQQLLVAAQHRSTARDLQSRADEIDPDIA